MMSNSQPNIELHPFHMLTLSTLFIVLIGHLLYIGQSFIIPIIVSLIVAYVLLSTSHWMGKLPYLRVLPVFIRRILVLILFTLILISLGQIIIDTVEKLRPQLPIYQKNLSGMLDNTLAHFGIKKIPSLSALRHTFFEYIDIKAIITSALGTLSSMTSWIFLVIFYTGFMIAERDGLTHKITTALPGERGRRTSAIVHDINHSIGAYLTIKTLINAILGVICLVILLLFGVDFAVFWAIIIAFLNYIPYIGSIIGVAFPVLLAMAQFASMPKSLFLLALLIITQATIGNVVEPKLIGKKVNMSPFVVMVALTLWSSLWGVIGAILAIPLTAMIAIILSYFESTHAFAVLLAEDVDAVQNKSYT